MSLRAQLPPREHYTNPTRHRRGRRTPEWPRWTGEGSACPEAGCTGHRTTHKLNARDSGLTTRAEYREMYGREPSGGVHAGDWTCDGAVVHGGPIWLEAVEEAPNAG